MNTQISFGHTIRINAPIKYADKLCDMINNPQAYSKNADVVEKLSKTFDDVEQGKAIAFSDGWNRSYVLTGKESDEASKIGDSFTKVLERIRAAFGTSDDADEMLFPQYQKYNYDIQNLINRTKTNTSITIGNGINPTDEINYIDIKA